MKKYFCLILLLLPIYCFSESKDKLHKLSFDYLDEIAWLFFNNTLKETVYTDDSYIRNYFTYQFIEDNPYNELIISKDDYEEKFIALLPDDRYFFLVYGKDSDKPMYNGFFGKNSLLFAHNCIYKTSSFLEEDGIKYEAQNLKNLDLYKPWVEGKSGSGIGETIEIDSPKYKISSLVISNGYVSRKKTTYYNNNRVKKVRITNKNNKDEVQELELEDTANPIEYKLEFYANEIIIEILSVYKGDKYDDTCVNFILCKFPYDEYFSPAKLQ